MRIVSALVLIPTCLINGCANQWQPRSSTHQTLYAETSELPVLYPDSTFVNAIDGTPTERGKGYVLATPGSYAFTIFNVSCPLPIFVIFCLRSASHEEVRAEVIAGAAYRVRSNSLIRVNADGTPVIE